MFGRTVARYDICGWSKRLRRAHTFLAAEAGMTLIELLVTMAIMLVVLVGVTESFASGARSEKNVTTRQQAESDARAALIKMRDDIHCSTGLNSVTANTDSSGNLTGGFTLELAETNACAAVNTTGGGSKVALRWCTIPSLTLSNTFELYRTTQTCDGTTGVRMVDDVVAPTTGVWAPNTLAGSLTNWAGNIWPTPPSCTAAGYLPTVKIDLAVNPDLTTAPVGTYELQDQVAIRNAVRCAGGSAGAGGSANPTLTVSVPNGGTSGVSLVGSKISAAVASSNNESAALTFTYFGPQASAPTDCTTGGTVLGTSTTAGNGTYTSSGSISSPAVGNYYWYASMPTDGTNAAAASACGAGMPTTQVLSGKWSPTLSMTSPDTAGTGTAIAATSILATLAGSSGQTTGTMTFKYFTGAVAPSSCTSGGTTLGTASPTGDGLWSPSAGISSAAAGTYWWYVSFAGDATDNSTASACGASMASTVVKTQPTIAMTAPATGTTSVAIPTSSITATLASGAAPTGTVTFTVFGPQATAPTSCTSGGTTVGTAAASGNAAYHPSAAFTPSVAGKYWWYASYAGDSNNNPAASACDSTMASTVVTAGTAPTVTSVSLVNGTGTAGRVEQGDKIVIVFSKTMSVASICSSWSGDTTNQSLNSNNDVTVTVTNGTLGFNDTVTVSVGSCTFNFGSIDLGSTAYVTSNTSYSGSGGNKSSIAYTAATFTLTITLGGGSTGASVASSNAVYTPSSSLKDSSGVAITGTASTGNVKNF